MKPRNFLLRGNEMSTAGFQKPRKKLSPTKDFSLGLFFTFATNQT
jgi:hypothetical protein